MNTFSLIPKINYGVNSLSALNFIKNEKILILIEHKYVKTYNENIYPYINSCEIKYIYFDDSHIHNMKTIEETVFETISFSPKYILSIGSIGVVNYSKLIRYYKRRTTELLDMDEYKEDVLINIPIPSAAGFESSSLGYIIDANNDFFEILLDDVLIPDIIITNPFLIDVYSLYDLQCMSFIAFCNSIGSYDSMSSNEFSSMHANKSIQLIDKFILLLNRNNNIINKTNTLQLGSIMSGIATNSSAPNLTFLISLILKKYFGLEFVKSYAILMPTMMDFHTKNKFLKTIYSNIANGLNFNYGDEAFNLKALIEYIKNISLSLDLPTSLKDAGIDYYQVINNLDDMANDIYDNLEIINSSMQLSIEDIRKILITII